MAKKQAPKPREVKCTAQQRAFIDLLITDPEWNQTQAYQKAYPEASPAAARVNACRLLGKSHVQAYLQKRIQDRMQRLEITQDEVLKDLRKIAKADIKDYLEFRTEKTLLEHDEDGKPIYGYKQIVELKPSAEVDGQLVQEIKLSENGTLSFKLYDKLRAKEMLGKHLGMFNDSAPAQVVNINNNPFAGLSTEDLRKLAQMESGGCDNEDSQ